MPAASRGRGPLHGATVCNDPLHHGSWTVLRSGSCGQGKYLGCAIDACASMAHYANVIFVETRAFTRRVVELLNDDDYARLQWLLAARPEIGDVMEGTGGLR